MQGKPNPLLSSFRLSYYTLLNLMRRMEGTGMCRTVLVTPATLSLSPAMCIAHWLNLAPVDSAQASPALGGARGRDRIAALGATAHCCAQGAAWSM